MTTPDKETLKQLLEIFRGLPEALVVEMQEKGMNGELARKQFARVASFRTALAEETDRGCALMAAALIDDDLGNLLAASMLDYAVAKSLLKDRGPLSTFASKADLALGLGLISIATHSDIGLIRKIRNLYAHSHEPISFASPQIADRCKRLVVARDKADIDARACFTTTATWMVALIHGATHTAKRPKALADIDLTAVRADVEKVRDLIRAKCPPGEEA